jgi:uncharacterized protein
MYYRTSMFLILFTAVHAHAASFDCNKAKSTLEHSICDDAKLNQLDAELGTAYQNLLKKRSKSEGEQVRQMQRDWLITRENNCEVSNANCLIKLYQQRISALQFQTSEKYASSAAAKLSGTYHGIGNMEMQVVAIAPKQLSVHIQGVEPTSARWVCDFQGEAGLQDNRLKIKALDDLFVTVEFQGTTATVNEGENSMWCGMGGSLNGKYQRH